MNSSEHPPRKPLIVTAGQGRRYGMGRMHAEFLADGEQTASRYSISEWWMEPRTPGPPVHQHEDDHIFRVLAGTLSLQLDGAWTELGPGGYALIPGNTPHSFENRGAQQCGFICINTPGGFEEDMPGIAQWFVENPQRELGGG